ncbi:MAG: hypothetical protein ACRCT1_19130 [Microcoleaceae cyanobacterium]
MSLLIRYVATLFGIGIIGGWDLLMDIISGVGRVFGDYLFVG